MTEMTHAPATAVERVEPTRLHPLVARMLEKNPDVATVEKLMALQQAAEAYEAKKEYDRALVDLQRDLPPVIGHDKTVDFTSAKGRTHYTHATLGHIVAQVEKPMALHGFARSFGGSNDPDKAKVTVTCYLKHKGGHQEAFTLTAAADASGNKNAIQAIGSTITYLRRYALLSMLGIATADMPDADEAPETPAEAAAAVDPALNLRAAAGLKKLGRSCAEAEKHLGRSVDEWTRADIERLREWVKPAAAPAPAAAPEPAPAAEREPGDDDFAAGIEPPALEPMSAQALANVCALAHRLFGKSVDVNVEAARALGDGVVCDVAERDDVEADKIMAVWNAKLKARRL